VTNYVLKSASPIRFRYLKWRTCHDCQYQLRETKPFRLLSFLTARNRATLYAVSYIIKLHTSPSTSTIVSNRTRCSRILHYLLKHYYKYLDLLSIVARARLYTRVTSVSCYEYIQFLLVQNADFLIQILYSPSAASEWVILKPPKNLSLLHGDVYTTNGGGGGIKLNQFLFSDMQISNNSLRTRLWDTSYSSI